MFNPRPKARLKIGKRYFGKNNQNYTAQGYIIFKEWDSADRTFYYWEEWEITGLEDYDSWLEYDHYEKTVTVYEPVNITPELSAADLAKHQKVQFTIEGEHAPRSSFVSEKGVGQVARLEGRMTYQLFKDDVMNYVEIPTGDGDISVEDYRINANNERDYYRGKRLSKKQQKAMFGRVIEPRIKDVKQLVIVTTVLAFFFGPTLWPLAVPQYETTCTPRTATTATSQNSPTIPVSSSGSSQTTNENQICTRKRVYFNGGSGGSGIGK